MMTTTTEAPQEEVKDQPLSMANGKLPKWAPWALFVGCLAVGALLIALIAPSEDLGDFNIVGAVVIGLLLYLALIFTLSSIAEGRRKAVDRLMTGLVSTAFVIALTPLISLLWTVVTNGIARFDVDFFTLSMRNVVGEGGGILHALTGTLLITLAATIISVPIGLMTAIYLVEYGKGRLARSVTFLVDVMTGIPSIVAGLFVLALFTLLFGPGTVMGIMGSIALSVLMIPVVVRGSEEMLKIVPNELREASYALGVPKWLTVLKVVLPTSIAGIATTVMLSISRVIGETAPLLLTAGYVLNLNTNLFNGPMMTLPVFAYDQYINQGTSPDASLARAWGAALALILIVMILNLGGRMIAKIFAPKTSGR